MKILYTMTGPWGTGSGTGIQGMRKELTKRGHDVHVFYPSLAEPTNEQDQVLKFPLEYSGVKLPTFPLILHDAHPENHPGAWALRDLTEEQYTAYFASLKDALSLVIENVRPDVIGCHHLWAIDHVVHELGYRFISFAHNSDQMGFEQDQRIQSRVVQSAKHAEYIFTPSEHVRQRVIQLYSITSEKVMVIPNGYDQGVFAPGPVDRDENYARYGLGQYKDMPMITFPGKLSYTKGADVLLKANRSLQQTTPALVAMFGSGKLDVFSASDRRHFSLENVVLMGHRSPADLAQFHRLARMAVLPSRDEGFCIAGIEAMGCGIPVVASDIDGFPYNVTKRVRVGDSDGLTNAILDMLAIPDDEWRDIGKSNYDSAQQYSWSAIVEQHLPYYKEVAEKGIVARSV